MYSNNSEHSKDVRRFLRNKPAAWFYGPYTNKDDIFSRIDHIRYQIQTSCYNGHMSKTNDFVLHPIQEHFRSLGFKVEETNNYWGRPGAVKICWRNFEIPNSLTEEEIQKVLLATIPEKITMSTDINTIIDEFLLLAIKDDSSKQYLLDKLNNTNNTFNLLECQQISDKAIEDIEYNNELQSRFKINDIQLKCLHAAREGRKYTAYKEITNSEVLKQVHGHFTRLGFILEKKEVKPFQDSYWRISWN